MSENNFKLTKETISEIEEKVNKGLDEVRNGMKERLIKAGCYTEFSFMTVCEIGIEIETEKVSVIDPILLSFLKGTGLKESEVWNLKKK